MIRFKNSNLFRMASKVFLDAQSSFKKSKLVELAALYLLLIGLSACGGHPAKQDDDKAIFDEVIVTNYTKHSLHNVMLQNEVSKKYFKCNVILPASYCSLGFSARRDRGQASSIIWKEGSQRFTHAIKAEDKISEKRVGVVRIDIFPGGKAETYLD